MNSIEGKDRGGRDYWTAVVYTSCLVEQDSHVTVGVAGTGKVAVV